MRRICIYSIVLLLLLRAGAGAQSVAQEQGPKPVIVIFSFNTDEQLKKYQYYAQVVPPTLLENLKKPDKYDVRLNFNKAPLLPNESDRDAVKKLIESLPDLGVEAQGVDFLVLGACNITDVEASEQPAEKEKERPRDITITMQIINLRAKQAVTVTEKSNEVGALFNKTIDDLTARIETEVDKCIAWNKVYFAPSPYLRFHRAMSRVILGIEGGGLFILGPWRDIYNDGLFVGPYLQVNAMQWLGFSAQCFYFNTDSEDKKTASASHALIWMPTFNMLLSVQAKFFTYSTAIGGGLAITRVIIDPMPGFTPPPYDEYSYDPYLNVALNGNFDISIIRITIGTAYRVIFYKNEPMHMIAATAGLAFRF